MGTQQSATLNNMVWEDIFLSIDPQVIKALLSAVQDFRQIGSLGSKLVSHLLVEHFVGVGELLSIGAWAQLESQAAG